MSLRFFPTILIVAQVVLASALSGLAQTPGQPLSGQQGSPACAEQAPGPQSCGSISGTVVDQSGAVLPGARVQLRDGEPIREVLSDEQGEFSFAQVVPGDFQLIITEPGFAAQTSSGVLHAGEVLQLQPVALNIAVAETTVEVGPPIAEVAQEEMKAEEKQRVLGIVPDFYISYAANAAPLNTRQKFNLAWKMTTDPFTFVSAGGVAAIQQGQNYFGGYGQEIGGFAKRYGANYADAVSATFIGDAILPSLLKQDPRYFYKGTGSKSSRVLYALANSVICKGDNGHWQPNYSRVLGHLAAAGISNLYYPAQDRHGAALTFENGAIGIGGSAVANLLHEFLVRRFTPKAHNPAPDAP